MKKKAAVCLMIFLYGLMILLPGTISFAEGGVLPSLTETVGIAMPSFGDALLRYPDEEMENGDGSVTEIFNNVSEADFTTFSIYLEEQGAELDEYKVDKGILSAVIRIKNHYILLTYNIRSREANIIYPSGTFDERTRIAKTHFDIAQNLLAEGNVSEAYEEIFTIPQFQTYTPVTSLFENDEQFAAAASREEKVVAFKTFGNVVTFGIYPQTEEGRDKTPIEWIVLDYDRTNHRSLLISKYGLETMPYNKTRTSITWEKCSLRAWLNGQFWNKAFNNKERSSILITDVDNSASQGYSGFNTSGGNNTRDRIFLLSYAEAKRYFNVEHYSVSGSDQNSAARVAPTAYAQGAFTSSSYKTVDGSGAGWWWLRSPGEGQSGAANVLVDGSLDSYRVDLANGCVRPAFWINLESDIF